MRLTTEAELAELLGKPVEKIAQLRRRHGWQHVDFGRFDKRYTDLQIEQIIAKHTVTPDSTSRPAVTVDGQTDRSAKRGAA